MSSWLSEVLGCATLVAARGFCRVGRGGVDLARGGCRDALYIAVSYLTGSLGFPSVIETWLSIETHDNTLMSTIPVTVVLYSASNSLDHGGTRQETQQPKERQFNHVECVRPRVPCIVDSLGTTQAVVTSRLSFDGRWSPSRPRPGGHSGTTLPYQLLIGIARSNFWGLRDHHHHHPHHYRPHRSQTAHHCFALASILAVGLYLHVHLRKCSSACAALATGVASTLDVLLATCFPQRDHCNSTSTSRSHTAQPQPFFEGSTQRR